MKITKDLVGKKIIRTKPNNVVHYSGAELFLHEPIDVVDVGVISFYSFNKAAGYNPNCINLKEWDDGNWEIYHECNHKCKCWHRKYTYCPDCGEKL